MAKRKSATYDDANDRPSKQELLQFFLNIVHLEDGTPLGEATPNALLEEIATREHQLRTLKNFLGMCGEKVFTVRDGIRLALVMADLVDQYQSIQQSLFDYVAEELGLDPTTMSDEETITVNSKVEAHIEAWTEQKEISFESLLQKRLSALDSVNARMSAHEEQYGAQIWHGHFNT